MIKSHIENGKFTSVGATLEALAQFAASLRYWPEVDLVVKHLVEDGYSQIASRVAGLRPEQPVLTRQESATLALNTRHSIKDAYNIAKRYSILREVTPQLLKRAIEEGGKAGYQVANDLAIYRKDSPWLSSKEKVDIILNALSMDETDLGDLCLLAQEIGVLDEVRNELIERALTSEYPCSVMSAFLTDPSNPLKGTCLSKYQFDKLMHQLEKTYLLQ